MANLGSIAMLAETDGLVVVDKPAGVSCHDVVKTIKSHFNLVKVGHGGTIDPAASGVFLVLLGDANRFANDLMGADRAWRATFTFGRETDTGDALGHVLAEKPVAFDRAALEAALGEFRGDVFQTPPEFSAVRLPGRSDCEIVRTAAGDELAPRLVHVYRLAVQDFTPPAATFEIVSTKGVSLRALARDLGRALGCGACVTEQRRVRAARFTLEDALPFMDLVKLDAVDFKARVVPMAKVFGR